MTFFSGFQTNAVQSNAFQVVLIGATPQPDISGGWSRDEWYVPVKKKKIEKEIAVIETNIIGLQQKAQEIRLKELSLARIKRKDKEIKKLNAELSYLLVQIQQQQKELLGLQNDLALLVLVMANPFLRISGAVKFYT